MELEPPLQLGAAAGAGQLRSRLLRPHDPRGQLGHVEFAGLRERPHARRGRPPGNRGWLLAHRVRFAHGDERPGPERRPHLPVRRERRHHLPHHRHRGARGTRRPHAGPERHPPGACGRERLHPPQRRRTHDRGERHPGKRWLADGAPQRRHREGHGPAAAGGVPPVSPGGLRESRRHGGGPGHADPPADARHAGRSAGGRDRRGSGRAGVGDRKHRGGRHAPGGGGRAASRHARARKTCPSRRNGGCSTVRSSRAASTPTRTPGWLSGITGPSTRSG